MTSIGKWARGLVSPSTSTKCIEMRDGPPLTSLQAACCELWPDQGKNRGTNQPQSSSCGRGLSRGCCWLLCQAPSCLPGTPLAKPGAEDCCASEDPHSSAIPEPVKGPPSWTKAHSLCSSTAQSMREGQTHGKSPCHSGNRWPSHRLLGTGLRLAGKRLRDI